MSPFICHCESLSVKHVNIDYDISYVFGIYEWLSDTVLET